MNAFTEDYFVRGKETGLSNFENYRWLPDNTISMATHLKRYLGLKDNESIFDFGCARGYLVKAMRMLNVQAWGYDISEWAIQNCDPEVKPFVSNHLNGASYSAIFCKDVAEHIPPAELRGVVHWMQGASNKIFFIVPLSKETNGDYVHEKEENDKTHVNRWTLPDWLRFFESCSPSFVVSGSYRYPGLKPGCYEVECGYGFITLNRI